MAYEEKNESRVGVNVLDYAFTT